MKERPILFSGPMVRAILEGRKTQTRRIAKAQSGPELAFQSCPYGQPGDRLWVRETFRCNGTAGGPRITYKACGDSKCFENAPDSHWWLEDDNNWRPSIHMPRWASRLTLEIVSVRVERLQDISEEDAKAEGVSDQFLVENRLSSDRKYGFQFLWESINGPESWDANPWVWVIEFRKL